MRDKNTQTSIFAFFRTKQQKTEGYSKVSAGEYSFPPSRCSSAFFPSSHLWVQTACYHHVSSDAMTYRPFSVLLSEVERTTQNTELSPRDGSEPLACRYVSG